MYLNKKILTIIHVKIINLLIYTNNYYLKYTHNLIVNINNNRYIVLLYKNL